MLMYKYSYEELCTMDSKLEELKRLASAAPETVLYRLISMAALEAKERQDDRRRPQKIARRA